MAAQHEIGRHRAPADPPARVTWPRTDGGRILVAVFAVAVVALFIAGWFWLADGRRLWGAALAILASPDLVRQWVAGFGAWAPVVFFVVVAAQVIVAPILGSILPPVGAAAFGPLAGLALMTGGTLAGSAAVFALTRRWGRPLAARIVGRETLDRYAGIVAANGGVWLFLIYLLPLLPDDAISAVAGLSRISFRRFVLLSTIGRLPGTVLAVYATARLLTGPAWIWLAVAIVTAAGIALAFRYRLKVEAWLVRRAAGVRTKPSESERE
ncbi:MAG: TVP38/TMEM64 family protein [Ktedonobacterales bacterium]